MNFITFLYNVNQEVWAVVDGKIIQSTVVHLLAEAYNDEDGNIVEVIEYYVKDMDDNVYKVSEPNLFETALDAAQFATQNNIICP